MKGHIEYGLISIYIYIHEYKILQGRKAPLLLAQERRSDPVLVRVLVLVRVPLVRRVPAEDGRAMVRGLRERTTAEIRFAY